MKKKKFQIFWTSFIFLTITTVIVLSSGILSSVTLINVAGSSAIQPLMVKFSNNYFVSDLVTQAGGSGVGINSVLEGTKNIGMASKWPKVIKSNLSENISDKDRERSDTWIAKKIKTVTIAWDGMGLVYKPKNENDQEVIDVNKDTITKIYKAFAGFEEFSFKDLGLENDDTKITPFARSGGALISGTADAFYKDSNLKLNFTPEEKSNIDRALIEGGYGKYTKQTAEANSQSWAFVKNENKVGSMVYLSAGFINNNMDEILNSGFKVATYSGDEEGSEERVTINSNKISNGYDWFRPLNVMLSITRQDNDKNKEILEIHAKNFIDWIFGWTDENNMAKKIIEKEGYINLTNKEILELMCLNDDLKTFWQTTDEDIFNRDNMVNYGK